MGCAFDSVDESIQRSELYKEKRERERDQSRFCLNQLWKFLQLVAAQRNPEPKAASALLQTLSFPFEFLDTLDPLDLRGMLSDVRVQLKERVVFTSQL